MKKIVSLAVLMGLVTVPSFAATRGAVPSHLTKNKNGGYDVTYNYKDKEKTGWYVTGRAELGFLNFKNEYSGSGHEDFGEDKYSFQPVFGGSIAAGKKVNYFWRAEVEGGYLGYFSDDDPAAEFSISMPYLMVNGFYDFTNDFYVGAGFGATMAHYEMKSALFDSYSKEKTAFSPMAGLMFGWAHKLDENLVVDLRYRLMGISGSEMKTGAMFDTETGNAFHGDFKSKTGLILDNSLSLGIRYEF